MDGFYVINLPFWSLKYIYHSSFRHVHYIQSGLKWTNSYLIWYFAIVMPFKYLKLVKSKAKMPFAIVKPFINCFCGINRMHKYLKQFNVSRGYDYKWTYDLEVR